MPRRTPTRLRPVALAAAAGLRASTRRLRLALVLAAAAGLCAPGPASARPGQLSQLSHGTDALNLPDRTSSHLLAFGTGAHHLSFGTALLAPAEAPKPAAKPAADPAAKPAAKPEADRASSPPQAADIPAQLAGVAAALAAAEDVVAAAEQSAAKDSKRSDAELARRLVDGQVMLTQRDSERAAVVFLDLLENAPGSPAAAQARYYLGEALLLLGMRRWAAECFSYTLADPSADARRLHQQSVARLLGLASPARSQGFARKPGLGALPELRARMQALGLATTAPQIPADAPRGELGPTDVMRLRGWVAAIAADQRSAELRYAHGRHLFLSREYAAAFAELDALAPVDQPIDVKGRDGRWRLRATYIAGASAAALGQIDLALERFDRLARTRVRASEDREIRDLAWLARGRIIADRGEHAEALRAYRQVGRDSPLFGEAMYEAAWALLRAGRPEVALAALDLVISRDPDGPIAPEALQLRGKLQIQQRAWKAASAEFTALRRDFENRARALAGALTVEADAAAYYAAVASSDGREFKLDALLPRGALALARGMRRVGQAEQLARETGAVAAMLTETRELLARMEAAADAPERPRLFTDLGAHWTAIDQSSFELVDAAEVLLARAGEKLTPDYVAKLEAQRKEQRAAIDLLRTGNSARARRISGLGEAVPELDRESARLRAQVVALERSQLASGKPRSAAFFSEAAGLRSELAASEAQADDLRARLGHARALLRFTDPLLATRRKELATYRSFLVSALDATSKAAGDPAVSALFARMRQVEARLAAARVKLEVAAAKRLAAAIVVLREERANLDQYAGELAELRERSLATVGSTTAAAVRDLGAELRYWTTRSEVGQLDVAWALQHAEQDEAEQLERSRDQSFKELDRALDQVMEEID